jgi:hypothetical protein
MNISNISIIGLGLIGGSIATSVKNNFAVSGAELIIIAAPISTYSAIFTEPLTTTP